MNKDTFDVSKEEEYEDIQGGMFLGSGGDVLANRASYDEMAKQRLL